MSADALPITPSRFASALPDLPLSSLYAKHAELSNQIAHLHASNAQLEDFARDNDDRECYEAVLENRVVVKRFEERIELLRKEVEGRGLLWRPDGEVGEGKGETVETVNGSGNGDVNGTARAGVREGAGTGTGTGATAEGDGEDGVFL
ncbi:hypothetical protein IQ07DRAFT_587137 [Pyrenochaeta sp. DS3sAY3a]|nr:hypothetical protein IQ07DRAFT_587137 [Pyrenochaeta sp. DS3sAY3a]